MLFVLNTSKIFRDKKSNWNKKPRLAKTRGVRDKGFDHLGKKLGFLEIWAHSGLLSQDTMKE